MSVFLRALCVFLSVSFAVNSMASGRDGTWWLGNTPNSQLTYVQGFLDGVLGAFSVSVFVNVVVA